jgi:hypothetical protein
MHRRRMTRALLIGALVVGIVGIPSGASAVVPIQPGSRMTLVDLDGEHRAIGTCSLGYVFDGKDEHTGKVFISTAAHCATDVGDDVMLLETSEVFGDYAAIGDSSTSAGDWALIEVRPEYHARISAAFKGYPQYPTDRTVPGHTAEGDSIRQTDWPYGGVPRQSRLVSDTGESYVIAGPVIPFDSGGPLAHEASGGALGLVSRGHNCRLPSLSCETYSGPTVQGILGKAAEAGFPIDLRTV